MTTENTWLNIWEKKYTPNQLEPLHKKDGFDFLSSSEWSNMISQFLASADIPKNYDILEVGCGGGAFLNEIKEMKFLSGVDYSKNAIEDTKKNVFYESHLEYF